MDFQLRNIVNGWGMTFGTFPSRVCVCVGDCCSKLQAVLDVTPEDFGYF